MTKGRPGSAQERDTRLELAWAAGLFEGEGTAYNSPDRRWPTTPRISLAVRMTDEDAVRRFGTAVNVGKVYGPYGPYQHRSSKPEWMWSTGKFEHIQAVIAMLWWGLGSRRKAQCRTVLGR